MRKEILANQAAMSAYLSTRNPGSLAAAPTPVPPVTTEVLVSTLQPVLAQTIHTYVGPLLADAQTKVEEMLGAQERELNTTLVSKLAATMQTVQAIKMWADRIGLDGHVGGVMNNGRSM